jgi:CheY-like chemotaxis protein
MTTAPLLPSKFAAPMPSGPGDKKKRVLLIDNSCHKRELRAEIMRKLGMDVDSAADIGEARCWWKADLYDLVLMNVENKRATRDKFCDDIRAATPSQRFAFLVGSPEYLSHFPGPDPQIQQDDRDDRDDVQVDVRAALSAKMGDLPQRWGILEASRRISAVRSASNARTQAMRNRPAPPRDLEARFAEYGPADAASVELDSPKHHSAESRTLDDVLRKDMQ